MGIRIGIYGYGNLGRGVELAVAQNSDTDLTAIFTRREPSSIITAGSGVRVLDTKVAPEMRDAIDVMILCGGSATDLPLQTPELARLFNVVDSFDTHSEIPVHYAAVDSAAHSGKHSAIISAGWDPGLFSLNRLIAGAVLPAGTDYTFWGKGVSQGHSDAIRRIKGVIDARQYTIPIESALDAVRSGTNPALSAREKHIRDCYVVAEEGADKERITNEIKAIPAYFADYDTTVTFISAAELQAEHSSLPHGGLVIRSGQTGSSKTNKHVIEYSLKLESNPEFTGSVLVACARAAYRFHKDSNYGCKTIFDIPPAYLSAESADELRRRLL